MNLDEAAISEMKSRQLSECPSQSKIALIITGYQNDPAQKAVVYNTQCIRIDASGSEVVNEQRFRYSQLLEFNEKLIYNYGTIRLLRNFPPKKIQNKDPKVLQVRMDSLQQWMLELVIDEEICDDPLVREFFHVAVPQ